MQFTFFLLGARQPGHIIDDFTGDIDAADRLGGVEFHRVVDLVDQEAALGMLDHVDRQHPAADCLGGAQADLLQLGRHRADLAFAAAGGVGDPVLRLAVDGGQHPVADHDGADVAPGLVDVFLDVEDRMLHRAQRGLVLQDGLGGVAVVDLGQQATPRADHRLEHHRVADLFDGLQGRFGGESHHIARLRIPRRVRTALVVSLSPQASATAAVLTVGMPQAFRMRRAYSPLV